MLLTDDAVCSQLQHRPLVRSAAGGRDCYPRGRAQDPCETLRGLVLLSVDWFQIQLSFCTFVHLSAEIPIMFSMQFQQFATRQKSLILSIYILYKLNLLRAELFAKPLDIIERSLAATANEDRAELASRAGVIDHLCQLHLPGSLISQHIYPFNITTNIQKVHLPNQPHHSYLEPFPTSA